MESFINLKDSQTSPREIQQARYALGEISRAQYQQLLADLN